MNEIQRLAQKALGAVQNAAQQERSAYGDERYLKGFTSAADISLRCIEKKLDTFKEQMHSGSLSKPEQAVHAGLIDLRSEIEAECRRFWRSSGIDWHPSTPIANGVVRPAHEATSDD